MPKIEKPLLVGKKSLKIFMSILRGKMKLFDYCKKEDYGVEHIFTLVKGKRRSFLQVSFDWHEYPSGFYLQVGIGNNRLIDILFWCWRFGASIELLGRNWGSWE